MRIVISLIFNLLLPLSLPICACDENLCHELAIISIEFFLVMTISLMSCLFVWRFFHVRTTYFMSCLFVFPCFAYDDKFSIYMTYEGKQLMILVLWGMGIKNFLPACYMLCLTLKFMPVLYYCKHLSALMLQYHYQMVIVIFLRPIRVFDMLPICYLQH